MNTPIQQMTIAEKIRTMEELWDDLCHHAEEMKSPNWHKDILMQRETAIQNGQDSFTDFDVAKRKILEKL